MAYHDLDPENPRALPNVETFLGYSGNCAACGETSSWPLGEGGEYVNGAKLPAACYSCGHRAYDPASCASGWYWWTCLPDSDPCGPFATEAEALADARLARRAQEWR